MTQETQSYLDMLKNFGKNFGLPQVDVEKLIDANRKNLEALAELAKVAAGGAQSVAQKQREVFEAGLREAQALARGFQPLGSPQEDSRQADRVRAEGLRHLGSGRPGLRRIVEAIDHRGGENHPGANEGESGGTARQPRRRAIRRAEELMAASRRLTGRPGAKR